MGWGGLSFSAEWFSEALPPLVVVRSSWHSAESAPQFKCSVIHKCVHFALLCSLICVQIFCAPFGVHCWTLLKPTVQYSTVYMQVQWNAVLCSSAQPSLMLWCTFTSALHSWQYSEGVKKGAEGSTERAIWRSIGGVGGSYLSPKISWMVSALVTCAASIGLALYLSSHPHTHNMFSITTIPFICLQE